MTQLTLIFIGDLHGHLVPRPDVLGDPPQTVGGLARLYRQIERIRERSSASLLINAGDTIQGSAEALFTRREAQISVLNLPTPRPREKPPLPEAPSRPSQTGSNHQHIGM